MLARIHHVAALQAIMDTTSACPWSTFAAFRTKLVETIAVAEARAPVESTLFVSRYAKKG